MNTKNWTYSTIGEISKNLNTNIKNGLESSAVVDLKKQYGENTFDKQKGLGIFGKILSQFKSPLIFILLIAGIFTIVVGEYTDAIVIFLALSVNSIIGTLQENKASQAFDKLVKSQQKHATVVRDGKKAIILAKDLVIGDVVILDTGMYVPADMRLFEEKNILINESILTGEWVGVPKSLEAIDTSKKLTLSNQVNMAWMGTLISAGYGKGIVVEVGSTTEIGKIAKSLNDIKEEKTPIKRNIEKLSKFLTIIIGASLIIIFVLGILRGEPVFEMVLVAIAVAVAAMPEGLPVAVTSVLAVGMGAILKKGGLVRNLLAAETLGSTTVILTDKTGTITQAKMSLVEVFTSDSLENKTGNILNQGDNKELLKMAVLSSDAFIEEGEGAPDKLMVRGRPLEKAIVVAGLEVGLSQKELFDKNKRIDLLSFESKNGFSASLNKGEKSGENKFFISGMPELILENAKYIYKNGVEKKITKKDIEKFTKIQEQKSSEGMRFTALAYKKVDWEKIPEGHKKNSKKLVEEVVIVGLLAFNDPIRPNAKDAIKVAIGAGTRVIMITGDNPNTAKKIATEVGIMKKGNQLLTGPEVEEMSDEELSKALKNTSVFARMAPDQKLRISRILQKEGEVVAMTGDGVNDAPALQGADIGIAMESGTEVAKEASDLVLLDGDFSVITYAIEEGRRIIDNLKKIVGYLLSTSFSEVFLIGGALAFGMPLPLLPAQILWANMIEEGLMNFAFVFEPGEKDLMKRNPRSSRTKNILTKEVKSLITIVGLVTGIFLLAIYWLVMQFNLSIEEVRTIMFAVVSVDTVFFAFSFKALDKPIWKENIFSNKYLLFSWGTSLSLLLVALFFPPIKNMLSLTTLNGPELLFLLGVGILNLFIIEITKYFVFERVNKKAKLKLA
ncbi:HAD-IC family P-type ATPase [Patescibacteria group bacterium]|nr:HAD-IC family P-type ATPase [Patescibacteria group bacterium]